MGYPLTLSNVFCKYSSEGGHDNCSQDGNSQSSDCLARCIDGLTIIEGLAHTRATLCFFPWQCQWLCLSRSASFPPSREQKAWYSLGSSLSRMETGIGSTPNTSIPQTQTWLAFLGWKKIKGLAACSFHQAHIQKSHIHQFSEPYATYLPAGTWSNSSPGFFTITLSVSYRVSWDAMTGMASNILTMFLNKLHHSAHKMWVFLFDPVLMSDPPSQEQSLKQSLWYAHPHRGCSGPQGASHYLIAQNPGLIPGKGTTPIYLPSCR